MKRDLLEALRIGDVPAAKEALKAFLAEFPKEQQAGQLKSIAATVRSSQPIRVGAAGEARREWFMKWAIRNMSLEELRRVRAIDNRFRDTAKKIGLLDPKPVTPKAMASTASKMKMPNYMGGMVSSGAGDPWWPN